MDDFGVVYIHSGGIWKDMFDLSRSTLPADTPVQEIVLEDHRECLDARLQLVKDLPFELTLFLDVDVVYCYQEFPAWVKDKPKTGIGASAWWVGNQIWNWPESWRSFSEIESYQKLPHWWRTINAGLMLLTKDSEETFDRWYKAWINSGCPLIEPAYIEEFRKDESPKFDLMPPDFHVPSIRVGCDWFRLRHYYFIHAIAKKEMKLRVMNRVLKFAGAKDG